MHACMPARASIRQIQNAATAKSALADQLGPLIVDLSKFDDVAVRYVQVIRGTTVVEVEVGVVVRLDRG